MRDDFDFSDLIGPVPAEAVFRQQGYHVWGGSMVRDKQGTYHLYYSRWPASLDHCCWVSHSEIAHAVADEALGPYRFVDVALPMRGDGYWDGHCTHNPTVHCFDGKYYLYYMGNYGDQAVCEGEAGLNWIHRNHQRIGVAVSDDANGPWTRLDDPIIDVSREPEGALDGLCVANPSVVRRPEGDYLIVYKAVAKEKVLPMGGPVTHSVARSESPTGPFVKTFEPIFLISDCDFPAEDPFVWHSEVHEGYYAIIKDMTGAFTRVGTSLALFCSDDGYVWGPARHRLVSGLEIQWHDRVEHVERLERPQVYFENGVPNVLFAAVLQSGVPSYNIHIPLQRNCRAE